MAYRIARSPAWNNKTPHCWIQEAVLIKDLMSANENLKFQRIKIKKKEKQVLLPLGGVLLLEGTILRLK